MKKPTNILQFRTKPDDDLLADLDEETWRSIFQVAAHDGITPDVVIRRALDCFVNDFKIGDLLLGYLHQLSKVAGRRSAAAEMIGVWKNRIQKILDSHGKNDRPPKIAA